MKYTKSIALLLTTVLGLSCTERDDGEIVASVDGTDIYAEHLRSFVINLLPGLRTSKKGSQAREDYLQTLIDRELLLLEAHHLKLDQNQDYLRQLAARRRNLVLSVYQKRHINPQVQVDSAEVRRYFTARKLNRERRVSVILMHTLPELRIVIRELRDGANFGELAHQHSIDNRAAEKGGDLGFMSRPMAEKLLGIPGTVFDTLKVGAVSLPLPHGRSYHIVRFVEDRPVDLTTYADRIRMQLLKQKRQLAEDKQVEMLAYELGWHLDQTGLAVLSSQGAAHGARRDIQLDEITAATTLFAYDAGAISIGDYVHTLRARRIKDLRALTDSTYIATLGRRFHLKDAMLGAEAKRLGIDKDASVSVRLNKFARESLLQLVRKHEVVDQVSINEADLKKFFSANREKFQTHETICFDELIMPTRTGAQALRAKIEDNVSLLSLARDHGLKQRRRTADSLVCMHSLNRQVFPDLWKALSTTPVGVVGGPVYTRNGYSLFKKIRHELPHRQTFAEAQIRARASLRQTLESHRFENWMADLRHRYRNRVQIFPENLAAALPEALLASTVSE